jgi:NADH:ubiquinone oxidoreductase subunit 6 (subunit J)
MPFPLFLSASLAAEAWPIALPVGLGVAAVYLLLPRPRAYPWPWGAAAAVLALLLFGALIVRAVAVTPETLLFYAFSAVAVVAGGLLVTQRNPARAALAFALVVLSTCGLFLLLAAPFLMAATIIIYAGAIVVTFLFVIMLAQQEGQSDADQRSREPLFASVAGFVLLGTLLYVLQATYNRKDVQELGGWLQTINQLLDRVSAFRQRGEQAADQAQREQMKAALKEVKERLGAFEKWVGDSLGALADGRDRLQELSLKAGLEAGDQYNALHAADPQPVHLKELIEDLTSLRDAAAYVGGSAGSLRPREGVLQEKSRLSNLSGPAPDLPPRELRRDAAGRPPLPAENVAHLGRSLFTDFLLAVELGGTLLLVATIGAIAITGRRTEKTP